MNFIEKKHKEKLEKQAVTPDCDFCKYYQFRGYTLTSCDMGCTHSFNKFDMRPDEINRNNDCELFIYDTSGIHWTKRNKKRWWSF